MIAPHRPDADGVLQPVMPTKCPYRDDRPCAVRAHHQRHRKTGPEHPLQVVHCSAHGRAFTLYPPGWVPYGRRKLAPARDDGTPVRVGAGATRLDGWRQTSFGAAIDAAGGTAWPRQGRYGDTPRWATQRRHLAVLALLMGVAGALTLDQVHAIAQVLGVVTQLVLDARRHLATAGPRGRYQATGRAIITVLGALPAGRDPLDALLRVGHDLGLWGPVFRVGGRGGRNLDRLAALRSNDFDP